MNATFVGDEHPNPFRALSVARKDGSSIVSSPPVSRDDVEAALAAAQAAGAVDGLTLLLRSAQAKVKKSLEELDARRAAEAKKAEETKEKHGERAPSADDSELAVRDDSSATAALSLPWVPSTRGEVKGEDCPNLSCKLSVR